MKSTTKKCKKKTKETPIQKKINEKDQRNDLKKLSKFKKKNFFFVKWWEHEYV